MNRMQQFLILALLLTLGIITTSSLTHSRISNSNAESTAETFHQKNIFRINFIYYWGGPVGSPVHTRITILENGLFLSHNTSGHRKERNLHWLEGSGQISPDEMLELLHFIVMENKFFSLPEELPSQRVLDGHSSYIEIEFNNEYKKVGGYMISDTNYKNIERRLLELRVLFKL